MSSKALVFLGFLFAVVVLISSEVAARDLAETSTEEKSGATAETNGVEDAKYGGYDRGYPGRGGYGRGYPGRGGYGYPGRGGYGYPGRGRHGGGGCRYGCCGYGGGCNRCCSYAGEAADAEPQVMPHN